MNSLPATAARVKPSSNAPAPILIPAPRYAGKVYPPARCDVALVSRVVYPCEMIPEGCPGVVRLNGQAYWLYPLVSFEGDGFVVEGYRFVKADGEARDVRAARWGLECDCADATFRRREGNACKHAAAVKQLREAGELV